MALLACTHSPLAYIVFLHVATLGVAADHMGNIGSTLTQLSMINKISTGHPLIDILLCCLVPLLMNVIGSRIADAFDGWDFSWSRSYKYSRTIVFKENEAKRWFAFERELVAPPTSLLQQAVLAAINKNPGLSTCLPNAELKLGLAPRTKSCASGTQAETFLTPSNGRDDPKDDMRLQPLRSAMVQVLPPKGVWVEIVKGVQFCHQEAIVPVANKDGTNNVRSQFTFTFRSNAPNGNLLIDDLVKDAFEEYQKEQLEAVDMRRFLYVPILLTGSGYSKTPEELRRVTMCKRYALGNQRTFHTFWHPDKDCILQLVDDFQHSTGKFAIRGYPQKLGFLLHGPPGTGKTSFIKALAQYTDRNIVTIPLSLIETNQQLMDLMFDQQFALPTQEAPVILPYDKTIFVFEDVDAAGDVVLRRAPHGQRTTVTTTALRIQHHQEEAVQLCHTTHSTSRLTGEALGEEGDVTVGAGNEEEDVILCADQDPTPKVKKVKTHTADKEDSPPPKDALNLAGLLNVLDGVVETPGRIVVMTSNYPGKLDPALTRAGRINKQVYMGRLLLPQALQMVRHYFPGIGEWSIDEFSRCWVDECWSPAELEALCAECRSGDDLVQQLQNRTGVKDAGGNRGGGVFDEIRASADGKRSGGVFDEIRASADGKRSGGVFDEIRATADGKSSGGVFDEIRVSAGGGVACS